MRTQIIHIKYYGNMFNAWKKNMYKYVCNRVRVSRTTWKKKNYDSKIIFNTLCIRSFLVFILFFYSSEDVQDIYIFIYTHTYTKTKRSDCLSRSKKIFLMKTSWFLSVYYIKILHIIFNRVSWLYYFMRLHRAHARYSCIPYTIIIINRRFNNILQILEIL